jgi:hypothetical protein
LVHAAKIKADGMQGRLANQRKQHPERVFSFLWGKFGFRHDMEGFRQGFMSFDIFKLLLEVDEMKYALIVIFFGIFLYFVNIFLIKYFISKKMPEVLKIDRILPPPKGKEYLWEKTAGIGIVPKWVSAIGLLAIPLFALGVVALIVCFTVNKI